MYIELSINIKLQISSQELSCSQKISVSIRNRKAYNRARRRMAIAYYTPPEVGPVQQAHQQQNQADANLPEIVDLHPQHFQQDANNNNVRRIEAPTGNNQLVSFLSGFVRELLGVFAEGSGSGHHQHIGAGNQQQQEQSLRDRRPAAQNLPNINIQQDNHSLPDLIPTSFRSLPDVVSCHAGVSLRYNSSSSAASSPQTTSTPEAQPNSTRQYPVIPLSPASSRHHTPQSSVDFKVSFEMTLGQELDLYQTASDEEEVLDQVPASPEELYRLEGARLRHIADSFERSRQRPSTQSTSFELRIVISFAVPTVALVGLGLAYLRRS